MVWLGTSANSRKPIVVAQTLGSYLRPLEQKESTFAVVPKMPKVRKGDVAWVRPALLAEVSFAEWTHDGHLRAPVFAGLREDKAPAEVTREQ